MPVRESSKNIFLRGAYWSLCIAAAGLAGACLAFWMIRSKYQRIFEHDFSQAIRAIEERVDRVSMLSGGLEAFFAASRLVEPSEYEIYCRDVVEDCPFISSACVHTARAADDFHFPDPHPRPPQIDAAPSFPFAWIERESGRIAFAFDLGNGRYSVIRILAGKLLPPTLPPGISLRAGLEPSWGLEGWEAMAEWNEGARPPFLGRTIERSVGLSREGRIWTILGVSLNRAGLEDKVSLIGIILASAALAAAALFVSGRRAELRAKEAQLIQAQKLETVGMMASGIAHDFNNVLSGVMGAASMTDALLSAKGPCDRKTLAKSNAIILRAAERGREIVARLLSLARPAQLLKARVDLLRAVYDVIELARSTCDPAVSFFLSREGVPSAFIDGDAGQISQALLNLAINAAHSMTSMRAPGEKIGGAVAIEIRPFEANAAFRKRHREAPSEGAFWRVSVEDSGVGMDKAALDRLFSPFYSTKRSQGGSGLGLLMAQSIVRAHGGHVDVESEKGKGTTVSVYLPIQVPAEGKDEALRT
jgi:signal transduction histidine kinase